MRDRKLFRDAGPWLLFPMIAACTGAPADSSSSTPPQPTVVDTDTDSDTVPTVETLPEGLNGTAPETPIGPPSFTAVAMTGENRTVNHLQGMPTIMWFYPAAMTGG